MFACMHIRAYACVCMHTDTYTQLDYKEQCVVKEEAKFSTHGCHLLQLIILLLENLTYPSSK